MNETATTWQNMFSEVPTVNIAKQDVASVRTLAPNYINDWRH